MTYERKTRIAELLVVHSTFIYEKQNLNATFKAGGAARPGHDLKTFRLDAAYHFGMRYTVTAGPFITTGTPDTRLYAPASITGSATGKPKNDGFISQFGYWRVQNIELGVQYRRYLTFNGLSRKLLSGSAVRCALERS